MTLEQPEVNFLLRKLRLNRTRCSKILWSLAFCTTGLSLALVIDLLLAKTNYSLAVQLASAGICLRSTAPSCGSNPAITTPPTAKLGAAGRVMGEQHKATQAGIAILNQGGNAIAPFKRPLSSMTPTILLQDDQPVLATGSPGGSTISTTVLQVILNRETNLLPQQWVDAPRIHYQGLPKVVLAEPYVLNNSVFHSAVLANGVSRRSVIRGKELVLSALRNQQIKQQILLLKNSLKKPIEMGRS